MSGYAWEDDTKAARFDILPKRATAEAWNLSESYPPSPFDQVVTQPFALGVFTGNGDGTIIEGEAGDILAFVDQLHAAAHALLDNPPAEDDEPRECANCGDLVEVGLSSRDWCDGCEADEA